VAAGTNSFVECMKKCFVLFCYVLSSYQSYLWYGSIYYFTIVPYDYLNDRVSTALV
jgi:hypothetical protein